MALDDRFQALFEKLESERRALRDAGGGGTSGGMEPRVAVLEAHMDHVRQNVTTLTADVSALKVDLATLTERVAHLPSKGFIVKALAAGLAVIAALIAFQHSIQVWLHLIPGP